MREIIRKETEYNSGIIIRSSHVDADDLVVEQYGGVSHIYLEPPDMRALIEVLEGHLEKIA